MPSVYDKSAPKKATNLSINSDLLNKARELKINLSASFEKSLFEIVVEKQKQSWIESNKKSIQAYNEFASKNGVFSKNSRGF